MSINHCIFLSCPVTFGFSNLTLDWMLESALTAIKIIGRSTKKTTKRDTIKPGVSNWKLCKMPVLVPFAATKEKGTLSSASCRFSK